MKPHFHQILNSDQTHRPSRHHLCQNFLQNRHSRNEHMLQVRITDMSGDKLPLFTKETDWYAWQKLWSKDKAKTWMPLHKFAERRLSSDLLFTHSDEEKFETVTFSSGDFTWQLCLCSNSHHCFHSPSLDWTELRQSLNYWENNLVVECLIMIYAFGQT